MTWWLAVPVLCTAAMVGMVLAGLRESVQHRDEPGET